jgi:hypothetical protein
MVQVGAAQAEVESWVLAASVGTEVGGERTVAPDTSVDAAMAREVGRWSRCGTPYDSVLRGSTPGWSCHNLPLLGGMICDDDIADKF